MSTDYVVSGLRLRSEIPLTPDWAAQLEDDPAIDLTIMAGECADIPWRRPSPAVIAESFDAKGWPRYSFCALEDGTTVARFYALADFALRPGLRDVICHRDPATSEELAGLLIPGSIVSYVLTMAGHCVLHASAVELSPASTVAFIGPTARGKTTCAALLCAEGQGLVTDDVLVVDFDGPVPRCRRGASALRLRPQQSGLISRFLTAPEVTPTPDERLAVRPAHLGADGLVLGAIVVPLPSRGDPVVKARRLTGADAAAAILAMPRIEGWRSSDQLTQLFAQAATLARTVPVLEVRIPWGPPFAPDIAARLIEEIARVSVDATVR